MALMSIADMLSEEFMPDVFVPQIAQLEVLSDVALGTVSMMHSARKSGGDAAAIAINTGVAMMANMNIIDPMSRYGVESAGVSYAVEEAEKASAGIIRRMIDTVKNWATSVWGWITKRVGNLYATLCRWSAAVKKFTVDKFNSVVGRFKSTKIADKAAADMSKAAKTVASNGLDIAPELSKAGATTQAANDASGALAKGGWTLDGLKKRISALIEALKPSNIKKWWLGIWAKIKGKFSKAPAQSASAIDHAVPKPAAATGIVNKILRYKWFIAAAAAAAAIGGVVMLVLRKEKATNPDEAQKTESEMDSAEQSALAEYKSTSFA